MCPINSCKRAWTSGSLFCTCQASIGTMDVCHHVTNARPDLYPPDISTFFSFVLCIFKRSHLILVTVCPVWATCIPWYSTIVVSVGRLIEFRLRSLTEYSVMVLCTSCTSLIRMVTLSDTELDQWFWCCQTDLSLKNCLSTLLVTYTVAQIHSFIRSGKLTFLIP